MQYLSAYKSVLSVLLWKEEAEVEVSVSGSTRLIITISRNTLLKLLSYFV